MKYYDGMGRDVTSYVMDLERENAELKARQEQVEMLPEIVATEEVKQEDV